MLSNKNIPKASLPILIKFHRYHQWGGGLAVFGFEPDLVRISASTATKTSHRHLLGKCCPGDSDFIFDRIFIKLADHKYGHKILKKFDFGPDRTIRMRVT